MKAMSPGVLAALVLALSGAAAGGDAHAAVITFDDVVAPTPQQISEDRYIGDGVLLGSEGGAALFVVAPSFPTNTPPNMLFASTVTDPDGALADSLLIFDFVVPGTTIPAMTDAVSFWVSDFLDTDEMIEEWAAAIFDSGGNLLDVRVGNASNVLISFSRTLADISRAAFRPSQDQEGIDTLMFNDAATVPEPASLLLFAIAVTAGSARIRRRRYAS
jgi:hypothetical protein